MFPPIEIHCQWTDMYGDDIMRVQHGSKWHREFENGLMDIHGGDSSG
jgi:hypothetical protein